MLENVQQRLNSKYSKLFQDRFAAFIGNCLKIDRKKSKMSKSFSRFWTFSIIFYLRLEKFGKTKASKSSAGKFRPAARFSNA